MNAQLKQIAEELYTAFSIQCTIVLQVRVCSDDELRIHLSVTSIIQRHNEGCESPTKSPINSDRGAGGVVAKYSPACGRRLFKFFPWRLPNINRPAPITDLRTPHLTIVEDRFREMIHPNRSSGLPTRSKNPLRLLYTATTLAAIGTPSLLFSACGGLCRIWMSNSGDRTPLATAQGGSQSPRP